MGIVQTRLRFDGESLTRYEYVYRYEEFSTFSIDYGDEYEDVHIPPYICSRLNY